MNPQEEKRGGYTCAPNMLINGYHDLHPQDKWLFVCLDHLCGKEKKRALSLRYISRRTGFTTSVLCDDKKRRPGALSRLQSAGLIRVELINGQYHITILDTWTLNEAFYKEHSTCSENEHPANPPVRKTNTPVSNTNAPCSETEQTRSNNEHQRSENEQNCSEIGTRVILNKTITKTTDSKNEEERDNITPAPSPPEISFTHSSSDDLSFSSGSPVIVASDTNQSHIIENGGQTIITTQGGVTDQSAGVKGVSSQAPMNVVVFAAEGTFSSNPGGDTQSSEHTLLQQSSTPSSYSLSSPSMPFALEWVFSYPVFGHMREGHGHDLYATEGEVEEQINRLHTQGIVEITRYMRVDGEWREQSTSSSSSPSAPPTSPDAVVEVKENMSQIARLYEEENQDGSMNDGVGTGEEMNVDAGQDDSKQADGVMGDSTAEACATPMEEVKTITQEQSVVPVDESLSKTPALAQNLNVAVSDKEKSKDGGIGKPRNAKNTAKIALSPDEQRIQDFYCHLWFVQVPPTVNATLKEHWSKLIPVVRTQEDMQNLYEHTRNECRFFKSKIVHPGNLVNCVNGWLQTRPKPVAQLQLVTEDMIDETRTNELAKKAVAMAKTIGHEITVTPQNRSILVQWNTRYFDKPATFTSEAQFLQSFAEMQQIWRDEKRKVVI